MNSSPTRPGDRFPTGIPFIVGNEGAERFSFYGMKAILYVYVTALFVEFVSESALSGDQLGAARARGTEVVHLFVAGVYAFPLLGAVLADRLLGKYTVIFWVSLVYCAGHAVLAFAGRLGTLGQYGAAEIGLFVGLGLIALGSGGIKPCVSANVGDQFTHANGHLVTRVFQIFYFMINFGSFFSTLMTPWLYRTYGPEVAFAVPGVLMGVATVVFWMGRKKFVPVAPRPGGRLGVLDTVATVLLFSPLFALIYGYFVQWPQFVAPPGATGILTWSAAALGFFAPLLLGMAAAVAAGILLFAVRQRIEPDNGFLAVLVYAVRHQRERRPGDGYFDVARRTFGEEAGDGPPAVLKIMVVFSMVSIFWALFDQHASTWVEQAKQMDLTLTTPLWLGRAMVVVTLAGAAYGGTWLVLRVSNIDVPRRINLAAIATLGGLLLLSGGADLIGRETLSFELHAAQLAALNPLLVMLIIPLLNVGIFTPLARRGIEVRPLQKMTIGMFLAAVAFVAAAVLQLAVERSDEAARVHALWQVVPYFIMTTAEVLVSVTGLEFAYTQAPRAMKSTIMGFWLLCVTFGNLIVAFLAPLEKSVELSEFFWLFAGLMLVAAVIFAAFARRYRGRTYLQA